MLFCSCDLDLEPMTLIYELDLDILKTSWRHTKNEPSRSRLLLEQIGLQTDRQTNRQTDDTENITTQHSPDVVRCYC